MIMRLRQIVRRMRSDERGAALVEFALVVPLLMAMMCVIIDFGLALHTLNNLTSALREGARVGAVMPLPGPVADDPNVRNRVIAYMARYGNVTLAPADIAVALEADPSVPSLRNVRVTVANFTYTPVTPIAPLFGMGTLRFNRSAIYRYEVQ